MAESEQTTHRFDTTHWSVIRQAVDSRSPEFNSALDHLCRRYWLPLYAFLRKSGRSPADSGDFTQGFFTYLIEKRIHAHADPGRGKFRTFLLAAFKRYLSSEAEHANRQKRAGGKQHVSLDVDLAEGKFLKDQVQDFSPEQMFDREWAVLIFDSVMAEVRQEYHESGQGVRYDALCTKHDAAGKLAALCRAGASVGIE